jgi:hypothetical protein
MTVHIIPALGALKLQRLTAPRIASFYSERLGHANVQITLDTYSHVIPGLDEQAAATVARLILEGPDTASTGSPGSDAANSAAKTGDAPHSRKEVRGEVPGELGGGGGI